MTILKKFIINEEKIFITFKYVNIKDVITFIF